MVTTSHRSGRKFSFPLFALGLSIGLLVVPLVRGNAGARVGAVAGLVAIAGGLAVSIRRLRRVEYAESERSPTLAELAREAVNGLGRYFVYMSAYIAFVIVAAAAPDSGERAAQGLRIALAAAAAVALAAAIADVVRLQWRKEGVERQIFLESTCVAFFVTVVASAAYALFEVMADAPRLTMWLPWSLGMFTWAVTASRRSRRLG